MEGRRRDLDAVVLRLVVRVGPVVDLRRSRSLSSPTASWLSLSETAQEPEPDSASAIDSALDEVCTPLPPSTDTGAAEVGEETLMASEEMEEPRRRWASVRGAVPCEGSKGAKGLMRALEGERGEVALGDEGPATRELGQDTKKIDEKQKERTVRGNRHFGRGAHRAGERGRRREERRRRERRGARAGPRSARTSAGLRDPRAYLPAAPRSPPQSPNSLTTTTMSTQKPASVARKRAVTASRTHLLSAGGLARHQLHRACPPRRASRKRAARVRASSSWASPRL